jgi:nucleoid DNA-binding protein
MMNRFLIMEYIMNKAELIASFADHAGISQAEAGRQIDWIVTQIMTSATENADGATIPGLGKLKVKTTKAREGVVQFGADKGKKWVKPAGKKFTLTVAKSANDFLNQ